MANPTPIAPGFYSGVDGGVYVGSTAGTATPQAFTSWSADASCPSSSRTNGKSGGYRAVTRTVKSFNGKFSMVVTNDATGDPEIQEGNTYAAVFIAHDGRGYSLNIYIVSISPSCEVEGDLGFDVAFESNGMYVPWTNTDLVTLPTGVTGQGMAAGGTV